MQVLKDFDLSEVLWYKIGGKARYVLEVSSQEDLVKSLEFVAREKISKFMAIGLGANLIFTDDIYDGCIIKINADKEQISADGEVVTAFAGNILDDVIQFSFDLGLIGL